MKKKIFNGLATLLLPFGAYASASTSGAYQRSYANAKSTSLTLDSAIRPLSYSLRPPQPEADWKELVLNKGSAVNELVIIDEAVPNKAELYKALSPRAIAVEISSQADGLKQLISVLQGYKNLKALHIFSHAMNGVLLLGNRQVTAENIQQNAELFSAVNSAVKENGDLLFYGCNLAEGQEGEALLEIVSHNTHVDVAASNDLTGSDDLGGDWDLEISRGDIESNAPFSEKALQEYTAVLAPETYTSGSFCTAGCGVGAASFTSLDGDFVFTGVASSSAENVYAYNTFRANDGMYLSFQTSLDGDTNGALIFTADNVDVYSFELTNLVYSTYGGSCLGGSVVGDVAGGGTVTETITWSGTGNSATLTNFSGVQITRFVVNGSGCSTSVYQGMGIASFTVDNKTPPVANTAPAISIDNTTLSYTENGVAIQLDSAGTVSDPDGDADWNGGSLAVQITANNEATDQISISDTDGDGTAITISGTNILANGTDIGDLSVSGGTVTNGTALSITFDADATNAIVQEVLQSFRFASTSENPSATNRTVTFTATDSSAASASDTRTVAVTPVNDAPVLDTLQSPALTAIDENAGDDDGSGADGDDDATNNANNAGDTVAAIVVDGSITDADGSAVEAIAVISVDDTNGKWQYSTDSGSSWNNFSASSGGVNDISANARLLDTTNRIRFVPGLNYNGSATFTFRAWDKSSGSVGNTLNATSNGGSTSLSSSTDVATLTINPVNSAPAFTNLNGTPSFSEGSAAVVLDGDVSVADVELDALNSSNGDYSGASLSIARNGGANAFDVYSFDTASASFTVSGANLQAGGLTFATFTSSAGTLSISFTSSATTATGALVDDVLQRIAYQNTNSQPQASVQLDWSFSDGSAAGTGATTVAVTDVTAATTAAAAFNTTTGVNLSPGITFGAGGETLTLGDASHTSGSTANGGTGTDTLAVVDGTNLTNLASLSGFENLNIASNASITAFISQLAQFSGTITALGSETLNVLGDGDITTLSNIEAYTVGDTSTNARTITVSAANTSVTALSATDANTFDIGALTYTGTLTGDATANDVLQMGNSSSIAGATVSNIEDLSLASGAAVSMTEAQFESFTGTVTAPGTEQVTITAATDGFIGLANIEGYVLGAANSITLGAAGQNVTGSSGNDFVDTAAFSLSGTIAGAGGTDTLQMSTGANISGATVSSFENLSIASGATVTMFSAQLAQFSGTVTASGSEQIVVIGDGDFTTLNNIETFLVGDSSTNTRTITLGSGGASVTANSLTDVINFNVGTLTYTGTLVGDGGDDTLQVANGANISSATFTNVPNLTLASGASVTMSAVQHGAFSGSVIATGAQQVNISGDGDITTLNDIEAYVLGDDSTNTRTVSVSIAGTDVSASSATDAITFDLGNLVYTGTLTGDGTVADTASVANGADLSSGTYVNVGRLQFSGAGAVTISAQNLTDFSSSITGTAGTTDALRLSGGGTFDFSSSTVTNIDAVTIASDNAADILLADAMTTSGSEIEVNDGVTGFSSAITVDASAVTTETVFFNLFSAAGSLTLTGTAGDDTFTPGVGADVMTLGTGLDTVSATAAQLNGDTLADLSADDVLLINGVTGLTTANVRFNGAGTLEIDTDATTFAVPEISITLSNNAGNDLAVSSVGDEATSTRITFELSNTAPVFSNLDGGASHTEGGASQVIDADVSISDAELDALNGGLGNYDGASVTIARSGGANSDDQFANAGLLGTLTESSSFTYNGTTVGTVSVNSNGTLTLAFNANATTAMVDNVLQSISYSTASDTPPASVTLDFSFNDGALTSAGTNQASMLITATNDDPSATGIAADVTVTEDLPSNFDITASTLVDPDSNGAMTLTLTAGAGVFTASSSGGVTVSGSGSNALSLSGVLADLNTYLDTASNIQYTGATNAEGNDAALVTIALNDGDGSGDVGLASVNVDITPVNDDPVISGSFTGSVLEGNVGDAPVTATGTIAISDVDAADNPSFADVAATLGANGYGSFALSAGNWIYTLDQSAVQSLAAAQTVSDSIIFTASDSSVQAISITITGTNDTPTDIALSASSVSQSSGANAIVGNLSTTDADTGDSFTYTLVAGTGGDDNTDFNISANQLRANDASSLVPGNYSVRVQTTDANSASFAKVFNVSVVDDVNASVLSVAVPADNTYGVGDGLTFAVNYSENVTVDTTNGTPRIGLTVGSETRYADYISGSGTDTLNFQYTVLLNDEDTNGVVLDTSIDTNGGSIVDDADLSAEVSLSNIGSLTAVLVDGILPGLAELTAVSSPTNDTTPDVVITSDQDGTVSMGGSCGTSSETNITAGTITLTLTQPDNATALAEGTYNDCTVTITDTNSNPSEPLALSSFIIDTTAPAVNTNLGANLDEGASLVLSQTELSASDAVSTGLSNLVYTITALPENGALQLSEVALAVNGTFTQDDINNARITYVHNAGETTSDTFEFSVTDEAGNISLNSGNSHLFDIAIAAQNDAPVITEGESVSVNISEDNNPLAFNLTLNATDVDLPGDTLTWSIGTAAGVGTATVSGTGNSQAVNYTPQANYSGGDSFVVQVSDGSVSDSITVNVSVAAVNDAPVISGTPPTSVNEDSAYSFVPTAADIENDALTFSINTTPSWATFNTATGALTGTPLNADVGVTSGIVISVSDGEFTTNLAAFDLTVVNTNDAPVISGTPVTTVNEDALYSFTATASDVDVGDSLTFSIANAPSWLSINASTGVVSGTPANDDVGTASNIVVSVSDGTTSASLSAFAITVINTNDAPTISGTPAVIAAVGTNYSFTPTASDVDVGDSLSFSITGLPSWASFDSTSGAMTGALSEGDIGAYTVTISVTDGTESASLPAFTVDVVSAVDSDGDGIPDFQEEIDGTDPNDPEDYLDVIAPEVTPPQDKAFDATGLFTPLTVKMLLGLEANAPSTVVAEAKRALVSDNADGEACCEANIVSSSPDRLLLRPGRNEVIWRAADAKGNVGEAVQYVDIRPLVSLGKDRTTAEGASVKMRVLLNGVSPEYPMEIPYIVSESSTATEEDHNLVSGSVTLTQGQTEAVVDILITSDEQAEASETLIVELDSEVLNTGVKSRYTLTIVEENIAPEVKLLLEQNGNPTVLVSPTGGEVTVTAIVEDANSNDTHSFDWSATDNRLVDTDGSLTDMGMVFDPANLNPGLSRIRVTVTDSGGAVDQAKLAFRVVPELPTLEAGTDTDDDGIADADEGVGDIDDDGIPDYLDNISATNILPEVASESSAFLIECDPGVRCRLGEFSLLGSSGGAKLDLDADAAALEIPEDSNFEHVGGVFDFEIEDLPTAGQSVQVVIPQESVVPYDAVYRKFSDGEWMTFVEDANNAIHSSRGDRGYCPPPGDAQWRPGLTAGDYCVQLTIEDGGPNDTDGEVNGVVEDPGVVAQPIEEEVVVVTPIRSTGKGGGGANGAAMLILLSLLALSMRIRKIRMQNLASVFSVGLIVGLAGLSPTSQAQDVQVRFEMAQAFGSEGKGSMSSALEPHVQSLNLQRYDDSRWGYRIALEADFGFEGALAGSGISLGYVDLGEVAVNLDAQITDALGFAEAIEETYPVTGEGVTLSYLYRYGVNDDFSLTGELGILYWDGDIDMAGTNLPHNYHDGFDPFFGAHVSYQLNSRWSLGVDLTHYLLDDQAVTSLGGSVRLTIE